MEDFLHCGNFTGSEREGVAYIRFFKSKIFLFIHKYINKINPVTMHCCLMF